MDKFHQSKKSAAVLKHAILDAYLTPFASKTGSRSLDNRVAIIDGYAGPGRYEDGQEGSGAMMLRKAREMAHFPRRIECHFVEEDPTVAAQLKQVASTEGEDVVYTISDGDIAAHLPGLLTAAEGIPLFTYLDPCGLILPMDHVASIFERPSGLGAPATEVLINLTAHLRRFAGMLTSEKPIEASLKRIDAVCGGDWWRDAWLEKYPNSAATDDDKTEAEEAVVFGYAQRLRERAGGAGTWVIDVRPVAHQKPLYYLIFATRHRDGMFAFGESASLGLEKWRRRNAEVSADDTLFGEATDWESTWKAEEKLLKNEWVSTIADRLIVELSKGQSFRIVDRPDEVFGDLVGVVRTLHIREAINIALAAGKTTSSPKSVKDLWRMTLNPA